MPRAWRLRLAIYGALAVVVVGVLLARDRASDHGEDTRPKGEEIEGRTGQGYPISMVVDGHRARAFDTRVKGLCLNRSTWSVRWYPADGAPVRFRHDGDRLVVREHGRNSYANGVTGELLLTMHARIGPGKEASGDIDLSARFSKRGRPYTECRARDVPWRSGDKAPAPPRPSRPGFLQ